MEDTLQTYRVLIGSRTVRVDAAGAPPVFADPNRILQVLSNLVSNAVKFTREGGAMTIRARGEDGMVALSVADDGPGIAPGDLPKLFKKFSQVGSGIGELRGSGLGLALCKELVDLHGGTIAAESQAGRGTTFTVGLPVYGTRLALDLSLAGQMERARSGSHGTVAWLALDGRAMVERAPEPQRFEVLERVAEFIRQRLQRGDVVASLDPYWIVILAVADEPELQAMVERLGRAVIERMGGGVTGAWGAALCPRDGTSSDQLLAKAFGGGAEAPPEVPDASQRGSDR